MRYPCDEKCYVSLKTKQKQKPKSGIPGSSDECMFNFARNCQTI